MFMLEEAQRCCNGYQRLCCLGPHKRTEPIILAAAVMVLKVEVWSQKEMVSDTHIWEYSAMVSPCCGRKDSGSLFFFFLPSQTKVCFL